MMYSDQLMTALTRLKLSKPRVFALDHPHVFEDDYDNDEFAVRVDVEEGVEEEVERETPEEALKSVFAMPWI